MREGGCGGGQCLREKARTSLTKPAMSSLNSPVIIPLSSLVCVSVCLTADWVDGRWSEVVLTHLFLSNIEDFFQVNCLYQQSFSSSPPARCLPARSRSTIYYTPTQSVCPDDLASRSTTQTGDSHVPYTTHRTGREGGGNACTVNILLGPC